MANTIITKNSATATAVPTAGQLVQGELAVNVTDKRLFTENSGGTVVELGTNPSQVNFADNAKAIFGAGGDLEIYHSGNNSFITDVGTGSLYFEGATSVNIRETVTGLPMAVFTGSGSTALYHSGIKKFETTSTGIDVTGTVVADGLTVEGNNSGGTVTTPAVNRITLKDIDASTGQQRIGQIDWFTSDSDNAGVSASIYGYTNNTSAISSLVFATGTASSLLNRMQIGFDGDISFYEDTGTTPKFFWDASAESLGIGTSSPKTTLNIIGGAAVGTTNSNMMEVTSAGIPYFSIAADASNYRSTRLNVISSGGYADLSFERVGTTARTGLPSAGTPDTASPLLYLDASTGNVGIGTASPSAALEVSGNIKLSGQLMAGVSGSVYSPFVSAAYIAGTSNLYLRNIGGINRIDSYNDPITGTIPLQINASRHTFYVADAEKMRIDSAGNVGIGTSSPSTYKDSQGAIFVTGSSPNWATIQSRGDGPSGAGNYVSYGGSYSTNPINGARIGLAASGGSGQQGQILFYTKNLDDNSTQPVERARIDASGNLLVGKTTPNTGTIGFQLAASGTELSVGRSNDRCALFNRRDSDGTSVLFLKDGGPVGSISVTGSSTAYNTSSDYRLKEDWVAVADASTRVNALKPVNFAWKANGARVDGFLAHELAEVVPEAVTGEKDAVDAEGNPVYQGIDQSKLVPLLTAALQEALAKIESLEARLDAANI
jgi:hypothetical protein